MPKLSERNQLRIRELKEKEAIRVDTDPYFTKLQSVWKDRGSDNELDKKIYKEFKKLAKKGEKANNNHFRLSYIFDIPMDIPWQILICLGKKGIGKTYEIMMLLNRALREGFKVVYVRSTVKDATSALERQLNDDDRSAVRVKSRGMGVFDLEAKYEKDDQGKPIKVGYFASITSLTCMQGGSYEGVRYIIWDECINDDKNVRLVPAQIVGFERFMSSVVRKKKDCKVLIFGNLLKKETEVVGDTLLDHYGINTSCDCKYIPDPEVKHSGLLFINTKAMFQGIEKQGLLLGVDQDRNNALLSNDPEFNDYKVCGMPFYLECEPYMSLLFTYNKLEVKISIRKFDWDNQENWAVKIGNFQRRDIANNEEVYAYESALKNNYPSYVLPVSKEDWDSITQGLDDMMKAGLCFYADAISRMDSAVYMKHFASERSEVEKGFKKLT